MRVNLASTSYAYFDGSSNITPGVTGTLPLAYGGTGVTSIDSLKSALGISSSANFVTGTVLGNTLINLGFKPSLVILSSVDSSMDDSRYSGIIFLCAISTYCLTNTVTDGTSKLKSNGFNMNGCGQFSPTNTYFYIAFQ